jgi:cation:H+ antiporter
VVARAEPSAIGELALATTAQLFALAWAAMRRGIAEIAVAGVIRSVANKATATLGPPRLSGRLLWAACCGPP